MLNIKIKSASLLTLLIIISFILSCNKGETQVASLTVTPDSISFPAIGGTAQVQIMSNTIWTINNSTDWCKPDTSSAEGNRSLKITVIANEKTNDRSASLSIHADELIRTLKVFQKGFVPTGNSDTVQTVKPDSTIDYNIPPDNEGMRNITSIDLTQEMKVGWNLGNTLEATGGETAWGNPLTTQTLIDSVKAAGFNAVRIPVAWSKFSNEQNFIIDENFINRVEEVVNYVLNDGMYAIINIHWDGGWIQPTYAQQEYVNKRLSIMWNQIANRFQDYGDRLLFAGTNEIMVTGNYSAPSKENYTVQNGYNQTFVTTVRSTGGRNAYRMLVVQGYNTNIDYTLSYAVMPTDVIKNHLIMEVHYYDPYDFTINENSKITQWGKIATDASKTETWANETYADNKFNQMKTKFVDNGIPVIVGEYAAMARTDVPDHYIYREYYLKYITQSMINHNIIPFYWDAGFTGNHGSGLFDRKTGQQAYPAIIKAITSAVK